MLPAIDISGINALPCGIKAEPTVDEVNYQAYFSLPEAFMLRMIKKKS